MPGLMVQGTTSDAGKSTLVTGLCRALVRRGLRVAPFKPQNMALNSAVTADGGEIGRAQAVQARACGLEPRVDMNPILLKPTSVTGSQVIVHGRAVADMDARAYHAAKPRFLPVALESYRRLEAEFDLVLVEGAGSPAEINLRDNDLANMGFARAADLPVILVGDIERGGVFAQLHGTLALLEADDRARVRGLVVNRFRGDPALLEPGLRWLEARDGVPVLGVLPFLPDLHLEAEDSLALERPQGRGAGLSVVVPRLPRLANHTDLDPLRLHPRVDLTLAEPGRPLPPADLVILPGSKNVRADLAFLRTQGWDRDLARHLRHGGRVLGICGGLQMLGRRIDDPLGVEGPPGSAEGLGWLDLETTLARDKTLRRVAGHLCLPGEAPLRGYEIHAGVSRGVALAQPAAILDGRPDGARSPDGQILATYCHGLFDHPQALAALLAWAGLDAPEPVDVEALRETAIERLADAVERHLDWERLAPLARLQA